MVLSLFVQFPLVFHHTARSIQEIKRVLRLRARVTLGLNLDLVYSVSHRGLLRCHAPPSKRPRCLTLWNKERRLQTLVWDRPPVPHESHPVFQDVGSLLSAWWHWPCHWFPAIRTSHLGIWHSLATVNGTCLDHTKGKSFDWPSLFSGPKRKKTSWDDKFCGAATMVCQKLFSFKMLRMKRFR